MRYTTKTEYGIICLIYLARHDEAGQVVPIKEIVSEEQYSLPFVEKIFQQLRGAGIVESHQGFQGGFRLARSPESITLKHIIDALEGTTYSIFCEPDIREGIVCTHLSKCGLNVIWHKSKELLDEFYQSINLKTLAESVNLPSAIELGVSAAKKRLNTSG